MLSEAEQLLILDYVKQAEKDALKYHSEMKEVALFISGVLLGLFTNIIATGLWDWDNWTN